MNKSIVLVIKPIDKSITFLEPIFGCFSDHRMFIIEPNENSYELGIQTISEMPDSSTIIFMGHGASNCLYGAHDLTYKRKPLVNNSNISIFQNKNVFSLSCKSSEFLYRNKSVTKQFIGFGDLPTDWDDIVAERDFGDPNYLPSINGIDISYYKTTLAHIIHSSFVNNMGNIGNFEKLFLHIKLMLNKEISKILIEKSMPNYRLLADIWFETKRGMKFYNNYENS